MFGMRAKGDNRGLCSIPSVHVGEKGDKSYVSAIGTPFSLSVDLGEKETLVVKWGPPFTKYLHPLNNMCT